jgi:hypothetical protein
VVEQRQVDAALTPVWQSRSRILVERSDADSRTRMTVAITGYGT